MEKINKLSVTKFFDVKTPQGIKERNESITNYSIGVDLYLPPFSNKFIDTFVAISRRIYGNELEIEDRLAIINHEKCKVLVFYTKNKDNKKDYICQIVKSSDIESSYIEIWKPIQIPSGIGMLIPNNLWCEVRTKSSNFMNHYTATHGTVDSNYTFGVGVQIIPIQKEKSVILKPNQKFAQLVFHEAVPVMEIMEIELKDFEKNEDIQNLRGVRTGGFGSTGKF